MTRKVHWSYSLALLPFLLAGCGRQSTTRVEDPGTHLVSGRGSSAVVWSDGKAQRVCSLPGGHAGGGKGSKHVHHGHGAGTGLDAALFRLCEARGNGDLSAAQYQSAVTMLLAHGAMASKGCACSRGHGPPGHQHDKRGHGGGPGMKMRMPAAPWGGCPECRRGAWPEDDGAGADVPPAPTEPAPAPDAK